MAQLDGARLSDAAAQARRRDAAGARRGHAGRTRRQRAPAAGRVFSARKRGARREQRLQRAGADSGDDADARQRAVQPHLVEEACAIGAPLAATRQHQDPGHRARHAQPRVQRRERPVRAERRLLLNVERAVLEKVLGAHRLERRPSVLLARRRERRVA